jgi:hypothetical protein
MMDFDSWDYDIPNIRKVIKFMFQTTKWAIFQFAMSKDQRLEKQKTF